VGEQLELRLRRQHVGPIVLETSCWETPSCETSYSLPSASGEASIRPDRAKCGGCTRTSRAASSRSGRSDNEAARLARWPKKMSVR
jgi:hypothetical protein